MQVTGNAVPVQVGGYKAVAGSNGDLAGPVHEVMMMIMIMVIMIIMMMIIMMMMMIIIIMNTQVPGLVPALAVQKQESEGEVNTIIVMMKMILIIMMQVSLSTGTGALVPTVAYYGKREAEADPALLYSAGLPYAAYPYAAYPYAVPAIKPLTLKSEVVATGATVPVAVGGYKAVAGDNGDLKVTGASKRVLNQHCAWCIVKLMVYVVRCSC